MTNEEAIRRLKEGAPFSGLYVEEWEEALNMAIDALRHKQITQALIKVEFSEEDKKQLVKEIVEKLKYGKAVCIPNEGAENAGMSEEELETLERGDYVLYTCGERLEVGRVKSVFPDGAFVYYHDGDTAARTPRSHLRKIANGWTIPYLGGDAFNTDKEAK